MIDPDDRRKYLWDSLQGIEHDWLAIDRDGHVALLQTAGQGLAPRALTLDPDGYDDAVDQLLSMPPASPSHQGITRLSHYARFAALRGVYVYDAPHGTYFVDVVPDVAVRCDDLPPMIRQVASRVVFPTLCFAETTRIDLPEMQTLHEAP